MLAAVVVAMAAVLVVDVVVLPLLTESFALYRILCQVAQNSSMPRAHGRKRPRQVGNLVFIEPALELEI